MCASSIRVLGRRRKNKGHIKYSTRMSTKITEKYCIVCNKRTERANGFVTETNAIKNVKVEHIVGVILATSRCDSKVFGYAKELLWTCPSCAKKVRVALRLFGNRDLGRLVIEYPTATHPPLETDPDMDPADYCERINELKLKLEKGNWDMVNESLGKLRQRDQSGLFKLVAAAGLSTCMNYIRFPLVACAGFCRLDHFRFVLVLLIVTGL